MEHPEHDVRSILTGLRPREDRATLVTLSGELGAGKTTLVQQVARIFGVAEAVTSPTFVLAKVYDLPKSEFERLIHIDAYRLASGAELIPLGFEALMKDPKNLVMLEWPEQVADTLPAADLALRLELSEDGGRRITETGRRV